jgi:hypothetical protein
VARRGAVPLLPHAGERQFLAVGGAEIPGLFAAAFLAPLVEATRRDEAAAGAVRAVEGGFRGDRFRSGVEGGVGGLGLLGPGGDKAPAGLNQLDAECALDAEG